MAIPVFNYSNVEHFIAYDPGGTTGYAYCNYNNNHLTIIDSGEFPNWEKVERHLKTKSPKNFVLVYESFTVLSTSICTTPIEVIGVIKEWTNKKHLLRYAQKPNERKVIDKLFPELAKTFSSHSGDALRHAVYFAFFRLANQKLTVSYKSSKKVFSIVALR
jgi:hypothetical protein